MCKISMLKTFVLYNNLTCIQSRSTCVENSLCESFLLTKIGMKFARYSWAWPGSGRIVQHRILWGSASLINT